MTTGSMAARGQPLSYAEQRLWFVSHWQPDSPSYNLALVLRIDGALDGEALRASCDALVERHESLRSRYASDADGVCRIVDPPASMAFVARSIAGPIGALDAPIAREATRPFDLAAGPLVRATLFAAGEGRHVLVLAMHHIVADGWSIALLQKELARLYRAFRLGEPSPLVPLRRHYRDHATAERRRMARPKFERHLEYWRHKLADATDCLAALEDRAGACGAAGEGGRHDFDMPAGSLAALKRLARDEGVTLFTILTAAYQLLLHLWSGETDVLVGFSERGRSRGTERLIGLFVNTVALRTDLSGAPTVRELVRRVRDGLFEAAGHGSVPFEMIVKAVRPVRSDGRQPLVRAMTNFLRHRARVRWSDDIDVASAQPFLSPGAKFDLLLSWHEQEAGSIDDRSGERLRGTIEYAGMFEHGTVVRMATYLSRILLRMAADPTMRIDRIDLLDGDERDTILQGWNATRAALPARCLHDLIAEQATRTPGSTAVTMDDETLSYAELEAAATRIARLLRAAGVGADGRVGICMERSVPLAVGLLAILKAGGAFVPLDPGYPSERLRAMLADSAPVVVVTHRAARPALDAALALIQGSPPRILDLDDRPPDGDAGDAPSASHPRDLAYVIYTSGSTGGPKGVMIEHRGAVNLYRYYAERYIRPGDRILVASSPSFDLTLKNIFAPLLCGAAVVFARPGLWVGEELFALARATRATLVNCSPSQAYRQSKDGARRRCPDLRFLILGGEPIRHEKLPIMLFEQGGTRLVNSYGPTEITDVATDHVVTCPPDAGDPPIGRPIANMRVYLLGTGGLPVPVGFPGEIHIGGVGVARGYLGRPDLSAERFGPDPFMPGERIYRTGDIGRHRPDGDIEFLGRLDAQAKIRGFRVEPAEIEAALAGHPAVRQAVVEVAGDRPHGAQLVAYYTGEEGASTDAAALRAFLAERLPAYMVPPAFVRLDALPLTPSLKLDRKALPAADPVAVDDAAFEAPVGATETAIAEVWARILGVPRVGRQDNFFDLGGHSLLAVQAVEELRPALEAELDLRMLFANQTVAALAGRLVAEHDAPAGADDREKWPSAMIALSQGPARDLFLFSPLGGWLRSYDMLVDLLGERFRIHGAHAYAAETEGLAAIADFADIYAAMVGERTSSGPPALLGYSFGGFVATECARRVATASGEAPLLVAIDLHPVDATYRAHIATPRAPKAVVDELVRRNLPDLAADALDGAELDAAFAGPELDPGRIVATLAARNPIYAAQFAQPDFRTVVDVYLRNFAALRRYRQAPYRGPALLYASHLHLAKPDYAPRIRRLYPAGEIVGIEAGHADIMTGAPIRQIATDLLSRRDRGS